MAIEPDFAGIDDFDFDEVLTGAAVVAAAAGRRVTTRPGDLFYDARYLCLDLGAYQSATLTDDEVWRLRIDVERVVRDDQRVAEVDVEVAWYPIGATLKVTIDGVTVDGDIFQTAVTVDGEGVQLAIAA